MKHTVHIKFTRHALDGTYRIDKLENAVSVNVRLPNKPEKNYVVGDFLSGQEVRFLEDRPFITFSITPLK